MGYLMRNGTVPGIAIYTRCEDELLARAEILVMLANRTFAPDDGRKVVAYYDVDPTFTIAEFKRRYRGRAKEYKSLMEARQKIIKEGWPYPVDDL